jgi:hypothetical protein
MPLADTKLKEKRNKRWIGQRTFSYNIKENKSLESYELLKTIFNFVNKIKQFTCPACKYIVNMEKIHH